MWLIATTLTGAGSILADGGSHPTYRNGGGVWVRTRKALVERLGRQPTEMEYQVNNWYYFVWLSGDQIAEQHVVLDPVNNRDYNSDDDHQENADTGA